MTSEIVKRFRGGSSVLAATALIVALIPRNAPGATQQAVEIDKTMQAFLVAFSNRDIPTFSAYFADDATAFFPPSAFGPPSGRVEGRANIAEEFRRLYERTGPRRASAGVIQPQDMQVRDFDGTALVTFHLGSDSVRGRRTFVLRRTSTDWKIVHLHASTLERQSAR